MLDVLNINRVVDDVVQAGSDAKRQKRKEKNKRVLHRTPTLGWWPEVYLFSCASLSKGNKSNAWVRYGRQRSYTKPDEHACRYTVCTCSVHPLDHVCSHEADVHVSVDNIVDDLWFEIEPACGGRYCTIPQNAMKCFSTFLMNYTGKYSSVTASA